MTELESGTLFGSDVVENDDGTVTVQLSGKSSVITEFTIPAGGGGGGGDESTATKIVLGVTFDKRHSRKATAPLWPGHTTISTAGVMTRA